MRHLSYSEAVKESNAYLSFRLHLSEPAEIEDFARLFAGLGAMFDDFLKEEHPDLIGSANLYVREVHDGSIIADLVPSIPDMIGLMDTTLIVLGFGALFNRRLRALIAGQWLTNVKKSDLSHVSDTVQAVATDPNGTAELESIVYEADGPKRRLEAKFTTQEAREAVRTIEDQKRALSAKAGADHPFVLLLFERPGKSIGQPGKRTGERGVIESISSKPMPLIYASELAERQIKAQFETENVFKQGFVVDVNVETKNGKPIAYRITALHQVIDPPGR